MKLAIILSLLPIYIHAQEIGGKVVDTLGAPLSNASVFISNTTFGTMTDQNGEFVIHYIPEGAFEIVISYVGYETLVYKISNSKSHFLFILKLKDVSLQNVTIRNYEKNGWERWGNLFTENFIGTSTVAYNCKMLNPKDIGFIYSEKKRVLAAYSEKPIIIVNKKLGYRVEFNLEEFLCDFNSKVVFFQGHSLFRTLKGSKSQQRKWARKRKEVYEGSVLQFMRAVYKNKLTETGFIVRRLIRHPNTEKERIKSILDTAGELPAISKDSMDYYREAMKGNDFNDLVSPQPLRVEEFISRTDSNTILMSFKDYLQVSYVKKKEDPEYYAENATMRRDSCITAVITLTGQNSIAVNSSGNYYEGSDLIRMGYWAWSEKIANMLPFDYWP